MKKFLKGVVEWKTSACMIFTAAMFFYLFFCWIIKKMRYTRRSLLFVALFLPLLVLMAWRGKWFPMEQAGAWVTFFGMFFLTFIGMTIGFDIYFRITGRKYDGMIGQYRKQKEEKGE